MQEHLEEEWRWMELNGTNTRYEISNYGRVRDGSKGIFISPVITGKPQYWYVNLQPNIGKRKLVRVHRLIAQAFIPNPENLSTVDHRDRNKYNNSIDNLRWVSRSQNQNNRDCTRLFKGVTLKSYCEENFDHPSGAYAHIIQSLLYKGGTEDEALERYHNYLDYGNHGNEVISLYKETKLLPVFLEEVSISLSEYRKRLRDGLTNEDIYKGYKHKLPTKDDVTRGKKPIEISLCGDEVMLYFPTRESFIGSLGMCSDSVYIRETNGCITYKDYKEYVNENYLYEYGSFKGTLRQLADNHNLRYETVSDRVRNKGWSLKEALETKRMKIKHYMLNGVRMTKKQVLEKYFPNIPTKNLNSMHSKMKCTLLSFLVCKGVDTNEISLEPCI